MMSGQSSKLINVTSSENVQVTVQLLASDCVHDVVDLQNGPDRLAREGAGADQERLNDILIQNIGNGSFPHINSGSFFALCMPVSQFCDGSNRVETGIFSESIGDDFKGLGKCFEAIRICTCESIGVQHQFSCNFCLWSTTTSYEEPFLDKTPDDTQGVMQGSH